MAHAPVAPNAARRLLSQVARIDGITDDGIAAAEPGRFAGPADVSRVPNEYRPA